MATNVLRGKGGGGEGSSLIKKGRGCSSPQILRKLLRGTMRQDPVLWAWLEIVFILRAGTHSSTEQIANTFKSFNGDKHGFFEYVNENIVKLVNCQTFFYHIFSSSYPKWYRENSGEELWRLNTLRDTKTAFLTPKRHDEHDSRHFHIGVPPGYFDAWHHRLISNKDTQHSTSPGHVPFIRFRVQFGINLHEWVFQKAEIARAALASAISAFWNIGTQSVQELFFWW